MPLRGCCAWTAHFSTICFTRVGECPFTGQHDLPSSLGVEVRRTPIVKVGCCRVGRLVQPHPEIETQRKCDGPRGVQELAPRKRLVLRSSRSRIPATVAPELPGDHRTFSTFPSQGEIGRACQHDNNRFHPMRCSPTSTIR